MPGSPAGSAPVAADPAPIFGASLQAMMSRVAASDVGVLLRGESGAGKDVVARELHARSSRRSRPFVKVNCAALPAPLLESELFGHDRGAFTGAGLPRAGKFEAAHQGTILLDEIADMPPALQAKLLQVLQDHQVTRLGSPRSIDVDVRVIATTNRDLDRMMRSGHFRADVYYRLQVVEIRIPPLRQRRDEIPDLVTFFIRKYAREYQRGAIEPSEALLDILMSHGWPGNVRELENMIKRLVILRDEESLLAELAREREASDARASGVDLPGLARTAAIDAERQAIDQALSRFHWNRRKAAQYLNVSYKTLLNKIKECGLRESPPVAASRSTHEKGHLGAAAGRDRSSRPDRSDVT